MKRSPSSTFTPIGEAVRTQYGAICWRSAENGIDVLLISSRETGRWVIPKGWPIKGISAAASAAREAWEEAGVEGKLCDTCLGVFSYDKVMPEDQAIPCAVSIFGLRVEKLSRRYPEQHQRRRKWFAARDAAGLVAEPGLSALLLALDEASHQSATPLAKKLKPPVLTGNSQISG
jgi:8-oxo-dGTP pyrophosphatase MutT (NUDIX family)